MNKLKVAVIGIRWAGMQHVKAWVKQKGVRLVAVADLEATLLKEAKNKYNFIETYRDYEELLDRSDADIIDICLPTHMHKQVVNESLKSGRHVLCEKPPAGNADEALEMHHIARQTGKTLGYNLNRRCTPIVRAARKGIAEGEIGDIYYGRTGWVSDEPYNLPSTPWRLARDSGGGSLLDLGVHALDTAWYVMGCPDPISASGFTSSHNITNFINEKNMKNHSEPADDTSAALIRFSGDIVLMLESSFGIYRKNTGLYCDLSGTDGGLKLYPFPAFFIQEETSKMIKKSKEKKGFEGVVHDFLNSVQTGQEPCVSSYQGVILMRMIDAISKSAREKKEIAINNKL